jgi:hypothetical protein
LVSHDVPNGIENLKEKSERFSAADENISNIVTIL